MKIVIIGATGHIGTYLVPRLVLAGHEVVCVSRRERQPYSSHPAWQSVTHVSINRTEAEQKGDFGLQIKQLQGDVVIDLICFTPDSAQMLAEALTGNVQHFIHCGTMWVHGYSELVPTTESQPRKPFGEYGINKAKIESYLLSAAHRDSFPVTILHPGHITGPGWLPINPAGNLNPHIFIQLAKNGEITLPDFGMQTLHHVHAGDVAQAFEKAIDHRKNAIGQSFHVVSEQAVTLRGYAHAMAAWSGREAKISFLPWQQWKETVSPQEAELTWDHIAHSPVGSIAKAQKLLNYQPEYSSLQAIQEAVTHYFEKEDIQIED